MTALPLAAEFDLAAARPAHLIPNRAERVFELHPALFAATLGGYALFLGILGLAFMVDSLVIPFAIFGIYLAMYAATPAMWARIAQAAGRMPSWAEFMDEGIEVSTGKFDARSAIAQVLILPALLVGFAAAIAGIRAFVL